MAIKKGWYAAFPCCWPHVHAFHCRVRRHLPPDTPPDMSRSRFNHSDEEIEWVSRLMSHIDSEIEMSPETVMNALLAGDNDGYWDFVYTTSYDITLKGDYDGPFYHQIARLPGDVQKTIDAVRTAGPDGIVLRARPDGCAPWPADAVEAGSRFVLAVAPAGRLCQLARSAADKLKIVDARVRVGPGMSDAKAFVKRVGEALDGRWTAALQALQDVIPDPATRENVLCVHGAISRIPDPAWRNALSDLRSRVAFDASFITLLNNCLCARLEAPGYVDALDALARKDGVGWGRMATLLNDCLCARLEAPGYVDALDALARKDGVGWARMATLLDGCLCARLEAPGYVDALDALARKDGVGWGRMPTLLNNCLCARLEAPGYVDALDALARKDGVGWGRMPTLLNGCLCKRLEAPGYVDALDALARKEGVGWGRMPTLLDGCLCKRLEAPGYVDALDALARKDGVGWARMATLLDNCLCKRLEAPGYVDALDALARKDGVGWARMPTLLNDCLCKRLEAPGYVDALDALARKDGVGWTRMATLLNGCLCKRLEAPGYVDALDALARKDGVGWTRMATLLNGCLCKRLEAPGYVDALDALARKDGVGWTRMATLLNGCLCKRLEAPGYVDALDALARIVGGWMHMPTFCQDQVACRILNPDYVSSIARLFEIGESNHFNKAELRSKFGGNSPIATALISARVWFEDETPTNQRKRLREISGSYAERKRVLVDAGWASLPPTQ